MCENKENFNIESFLKDFNEVCKVDLIDLNNKLKDHYSSRLNDINDGKFDLNLNINRFYTFLYDLLIQFYKVSYDLDRIKFFFENFNDNKRKEITNNIKRANKDFNKSERKSVFYYVKKLNELLEYLIESDFVRLDMRYFSVLYVTVSYLRDLIETHMNTKLYIDKKFKNEFYKNRLDLKKVKKQYKFKPNKKEYCEWRFLKWIMKI